MGNVWLCKWVDGGVLHGGVQQVKSKAEKMLVRDMEGSMP